MGYTFLSGVTAPEFRVFFSGSLEAEFLYFGNFCGRADTRVLRQRGATLSLILKTFCMNISSQKILIFRYRGVYSTHIF